MIGKLAEFWWGRVPLRMARISAGLGVVFGDGGYLQAIPRAAGLARNAQARRMASLGDAMWRGWIWLSTRGRSMTFGP